MKIGLFRISLAFAAILLFAVSNVALAQDNSGKWRGVVTSRPSGSLLGTWAIGGLTLQTNENTLFDITAGPLNIGACVSVQYFGANGNNAAISIRAMDSSACATGASTGGDTENGLSESGGLDDDANQTNVYGLVNSFPPALVGDWNVGGTVYHTDSNTSFETEAGNFRVGGCVKVKLTTINGARTVTAIETDSASNC